MGAVKERLAIKPPVAADPHFAPGVEAPRVEPPRKKGSGGGGGNSGGSAPEYDQFFGSRAFAILLSLVLFAVSCGLAFGGLSTIALLLIFSSYFSLSS